MSEQEPAYNRRKFFQRIGLDGHSIRGLFRRPKVVSSED